MRIFSRKTLREFWELPDYMDSEQALKAWYDEATKANYDGFLCYFRLYNNDCKNSHSDTNKKIPVITESSKTIKIRKQRVLLY